MGLAGRVNGTRSQVGGIRSPQDFMPWKNLSCAESGLEILNKETNGRGQIEKRTYNVYEYKPQQTSCTGTVSNK